MSRTASLLSLVLITVCATPFAARAQRAEAIGLTSASLSYSADSDSVSHRRPRERAIEYSDLYATRLEIHKIGSYAELPLFASEWYLGNKLLNGDGTDTERSLHASVAAGLGVLFTVNTVTGVWNLYDSRQDPSDRKRKIVHSVLMLASDAGFAWAGAIGGGARENASTRSLHKNIAIGSMGLSTIGTVMMWFWRD